MAGRPRNEIDAKSYRGKFVEHLRSLHDSRGKSVGEIAERIGVARCAYYNWLSGRREPPIAMFPSIAKALKVRVSDLFPRA